MKNCTDIIKVQENMKPGCFSAHGFLGEDKRSLADILEFDDQTVKRLGFTHVEIADRMDYLTYHGKAGLGSPVIIDSIYEIVVEDFRGLIPCPFSDSHHAHKQNTRVKNLSSGKIIYWTDLNIHMIREHGFYEGNGSAFRVEPSDITSILGM